jgi:hypothetical protein
MRATRLLRYPNRWAISPVAFLPSKEAINRSPKFGGMRPYCRFVDRPLNLNLSRTTCTLTDQNRF